MNWRAVWAITRKDMRMVHRSRALIYPLVIVPFVVLVLMPLSITLIAYDASAATSVIDQLGSLADYVSARADLDPNEQNPARLLILGNVYLLAPLFLMVPMLVSMVIAADTFAGEKERGTLEALLYAPLTDREMLAGKLLAGWLPSIAVSTVGFIVFALVLNLSAWPVMGEVFFPNLMWLVLVFWASPAVAGLGLGSMVIVSARVGSVQEASQLGGVVVLPIVLLIAGQISGIFFFSAWLVAVIGAIVWLLNAVLLRMAFARFRREQLLTSGSQ